MIVCSSQKDCEQLLRSLAALIRFLLNDEPVTVRDTPADTTILDYLRKNVTSEIERRTGTKEGCCSGDCGACTVVVGEHEQDRMKYRTMNGCITLLPSLHGKQLITVEDLADGDELHPVQEALVAHHASQCGYCTPGIVMSLFALHHESPDSQVDAMEALGGNLCRCTGYRPIMEAAKSLQGQKPDDQFVTREKTTISILKDLSNNDTVGSDDFIIPKSEDELAGYLEKNPQSRLLAGGTDLGLEVTQLLKRMPQLVYLGNVPELQQIDVTDHELTIGAAATYRQIEPVLSYYFSEFGDMLERLGSQQIRNHGTLGGNIGNASPIGDTPPVLLALDACIELRKGKSIRVLPLAQFFLDYKKTALQPGEYISKVRIPLGQNTLKVYKLSKRYGDDISTILAAINIQVDSHGVVVQARVAFGGMAAIPKRATNCENVLVGEPLNSAALDRAKTAIQSEFNPLSDVRASSDYRLQAACNLLERYVLETRGEPVRILTHA